MSEKKAGEPAPDLSCEICMKHIDQSEAETYEVDDYVHHFCGLGSYSKWQQGKGGKEEKKD